MSIVACESPHPSIPSTYIKSFQTNSSQVGRFAVSIQLGGRQPLSSSATNIGLNNRFTPVGGVPTETAKEMTLEDIKETIDDHVRAAKCAIEAGFDAVEIVSSVLHPSQIHPHPSDAFADGLG